MFQRLRGQSGSEQYCFQTGAFMHAMLAGATSVEAGMKPLMNLREEPLPPGAAWHGTWSSRLAGPSTGCARRWSTIRSCSWLGAGCAALATWPPMPTTFP